MRGLDALCRSRPGGSKASPWMVEAQSTGRSASRARAAVGAARVTRTFLAFSISTRARECFLRYPARR